MPAPGWLKQERVRFDGAKGHPASQCGDLWISEKHMKTGDWKRNSRYPRSQKGKSTMIRSSRSTSHPCGEHRRVLQQRQFRKQTFLISNQGEKPHRPLSSGSSRRHWPRVTAMPGINRKLPHLENMLKGTSALPLVAFWQLFPRSSTCFAKEGRLNDHLATPPPQKEKTEYRWSLEFPLWPACLCGSAGSIPSSVD